MEHTKDVELCVERCDGDFVVFQCHCRRCGDRQLHSGAMRLVGSGSSQRQVGSWLLFMYRGASQPPAGLLKPTDTVGTK